jgi:beta-phosphoglucomutase-like phosphatase (HAD superfamily)
MARIAIDIDSTLHHYWDLLDRIAHERFGVRLPYDEQGEWGITVLERDQLVATVEETHSDENIESAVPYPGAAEAVRRWHQAGHWIHVTSHRRGSCDPATRRWLAARDIPYHDLHCSFDKISRCVELGIDILVDDSPVNMRAAREKGMLAATLIHPWNEVLLREPGVISAQEWPELERRVNEALGTEHGTQL